MSRRISPTRPGRTAGRRSIRLGRFRPWRVLGLGEGTALVEWLSDGMMEWHRCLGTQPLSHSITSALVRPQVLLDRGGLLGQQLGVLVGILQESAERLHRLLEGLGELP